MGVLMLAAGTVAADCLSPANEFDATRVAAAQIIVLHSRHDGVLGAAFSAAGLLGLDLVSTSAALGLSASTALGLTGAQTDIPNRVRSVDVSDTVKMHWEYIDSPQVREEMLCVFGEMPLNRSHDEFCRSPPHATGPRFPSEHKTELWQGDTAIQAQLASCPGLNGCVDAQAEASCHEESEDRGMLDEAIFLD